MRIENARPRQDPAGDDEAVLAMTLTASAVGERDDFKAGFRKEIHDRVADQLAGSDPLPDGPVVLEASFTVGPDRNWLDLWWSTLDGLGPVLGQSPTAPEFHPRDGRIVDLGLHCVVDGDLDTDVVIELRIKAGSLEPALHL